MTEDKPQWEFNGLYSAFYQMFLCSELMSSTRLVALSTCWGKNNLQIPTICRKEHWWGAESKKRRKTGYNDSSLLGGYERGGVDGIQTQFTLRDRMEVVGQTSWEGQPRKRPSGMGVWAWGWEVFGNIEKGSSCISVWAPSVPRYCILSLSWEQGGRQINYVSSFCLCQ